MKFIEKLTAQAVKNGGDLVIESSPLSIKKKVDAWGKSRSDYLVARRFKEQIDPRDSESRPICGRNLEKMKF